MALSKPDEATMIQGQVTKAMAWRVKYRKLDKDADAIKIKLAVQALGVHPMNRGGVFPSGSRCKHLCQEVFEAGFVKEEVNHAFVVVEEVPLDQARSRGKDYESGSVYNYNTSSLDELLATCFEPPYNDVRHMGLSHNHMIIIMRAWLSGAKWDIPANEDRKITYCDDKGRLSIAAVAGSSNAKEFLEMLKEGMCAEVLSWKMDLEEPSAASTISQALNKGNQLALRTTELTAVKVLKGEIIVQMSKNAGQRVAFKTVRDRVREQLDTVADDPDMRELFDYLIGIGVGVNSYVDDLLEFGAKFVNSKKRQLRLSAFASANAISEKAPWTKIAVIKRAYRKPPAHGYCPSPEPSWASIEWAQLESLESLLRFVHVTCKPDLDKLTPQSRNTMLALFDVAASDAFITAKPKRGNKAKIQEGLIAATAKIVADMGLTDPAGKAADQMWINFKRGGVDAAPTETSGDTAHAPAAPAVIRFDETTGAQLNEQIEFHIDDGAEERKPTPITLPHDFWHQNNACLGALEADKASAVAALHNLHEQLNISNYPLAIQTMSNCKSMLVTTSPCEAKSIVLPPCVPKQSKVLDKTDHPGAVRITLKVLRAVDDPGAGGTVMRQVTLFVLPEFQAPLQKPEPQSNTAVAAATAVAASGAVGGATAVAEETAVAASDAVQEGKTIQWMWGERSAESMHPFWAARRLTEAQLQQAKQQAEKEKSTKPMLRFNCMLETRNLSVVCTASVAGICFNKTRILETPFLVNIEPLEQGEELILEVFEKKKQTAPVKTSWRDVDRKRDRAAAVSEAAADRLKKPRTGRHDDS